jgi:type IV pilus assembly protein PilC
MAAVYKYKGIQDSQYIDGKVEALNRDEAAFKLSEDGIIITALEKISGVEIEVDNGTESGKSKRIKKKVPIHEVIIFTKQLETMIRAGLPILETISLIEDQTANPSLKQIIRQILNDVESGTPLSNAFAKHSNVFDNVYINLLRAGESSGKVDLFLGKLVISMEKGEKIRSDIKGALTYPIVLVVMATAVIILMMVYVVPIFQEIFQGAGSELPAPTQLVVNISEFMRDPMGGGLSMVIIVAIGIMVSTFIKKNYKMRRLWHKFILKLPLFGDLIQKSALAKIAMIQGNLTAAGVPVMECLDIASSASDNIAIKEAMIEVKKGVFSGEPLSVLFKKDPAIFPKIFTALTSVGERTGNMEEMFESICGYYEGEMDVTIAVLTSLLEPVMIVFMGITIGFILVALYMPMFALGTTL